MYWNLTDGAPPAWGRINRIKLIFTPISIVTGLIAALIGRKLFEQIWALIDDQEPPDPGDRQISVVKLLFALALEGMIFRVVKGLAERASRMAALHVTGRWPGEQASEGS